MLAYFVNDDAVAVIIMKKQSFDVYGNKIENSFKCKGR